MSSVPVALNATAEAALAADRRETDALRRVVFFDGVCGLCNWSVDFVLKRDHQRKFQFAPLQGETARTLLNPSDTDNLHTIVLLVGTQTYRKSSAVVRVLLQLGLMWRILGTILWLIPLPLRNLGYSIVASNRYQVFGKKDQCRLPTPDERSRFLP